MLGYSVLYADSDVLFFKNPFPYLYGITGYDFIAQSEVVRICSGFMYVKSTMKTIGLLERAVAIVMTGERDQVAINNALRDTNTTAFHLPRSLFAGGLEFFGRYQYYWDRKGISFGCL